MTDYRKFFNEAELLAIVQELISRKSDYPHHPEEEVAHYVYDLLVEYGIEAELQYVAPGRPNVFAVLEGQSDGPTMIYNGHLDVVPPGDGWSTDPFEPVERDGKLYGRGAADMKSGVAAMLYAAMMLHKMGRPFFGRLILLFNVDEERENAGMHHFLKQDVRADYALISEPTDLAICVAHKGIARYRLRTKGVAQHAGLVDVNVQNAVVAMGNVIQALTKLGEQVQEKHDALLGAASLTITKISGGTAINIVPDSCEIEIDRRLLPGEKVADVLREIDEACARGHVYYEIDNYLFLPATKIEEDHVFVQQLKTVADAHLGQSTPVTIFEAACEAPFFSVYQDIPTIIFGPGSLQQAHIVDEYVAVEQIFEAAEIFIKLVLQLLRE